MVRIGADGAPGGSTELGVRPEHLTVVDPEDQAASFNGAVAIVERLGNSTLLYVDTAAGQLIVEGKGNLEVKSGEPVGLRVMESQAHLFGPTGAVL
jgi:multiple sugar transport system ATP-binding protein